MRNFVGKIDELYIYWINSSPYKSIDRFICISQVNHHHQYNREPAKYEFKF